MKKPVNESLLALRSLKPLFRQFGVDQVWLFGSRASGKSHQRSDWDLLVEFSTPPGFDQFMGLKMALEEQLKTPVDLLSKKACPARWLQAIEKHSLHVA